MHFYYSGFYLYCHLSSPNYKFSKAVDSMSRDEGLNKECCSKLSHKVSNGSNPYVFHKVYCLSYLKNKITELPLRVSLILISPLWASQTVLKYY